MKPIERILLSMAILLCTLPFPMTAQWVNGPEYNPSQEHAPVLSALPLGSHSLPAVMFSIIGGKAENVSFANCKILIGYRTAC